MNEKTVLAALIMVLAASGCLQNSIYPVPGADYASRPDPYYTIDDFNTTEYAEVYKVAYQSRGATIYGLLSVPHSCKEDRPCDAFVLLPADSITKESEQKWLGNKLNSMGFITLAIDQRGIGETGGSVPSLKENFATWAAGRETTQSMMVYDALAAYDLLLSRPETKGVYLEGESMGGRQAIIAGAIERGVKGLLLISTSGYGLPETPYQNMTDFLAYIDPDSYIGEISPRKILMIHGTGDWVISPEVAKRTYGFAKPPKKFILVEGKFHGYYHVTNTTLPQLLEDSVMGWLLG